MPHSWVLVALSAAVVTVEELTGELAGLLPDVPVTILGAAIGIYVGFRTNSAYERWWEARKLWGQLVNTSRHLTAEALAYLQGDAARRIVHRHILYVHALRCELRNEPVHLDTEVQRVLPDEAASLRVDAPGLATRLLRTQLQYVAKLHDEAGLDARRVQSLDQTMAVLLDVQGGCERIRNTPLPPTYGRIAEILVRIHAIVLPLAIVDELHWLALPVTLVICLAFRLMNEVGRVLETPFSHERDALPLQALSITIERDLRMALDEEAPAAVHPDAHGVLL